ncbi:MAG: methionyl-tRNA formyltransferase [Candidatus Cloacimonetes bacterium]|nr:methionyl-tRNA formyltransferase [Candidatus Cloacimonadota bacterium]MCF7814993.1 methionyl-tRNA formyltransferase [Candidatus Cloacimonadota bacterium]MCF7868409.1 methionyl-tRNA formyltransferase [Candidatus Cloacimonadota bacterium]MCF7883882.1 methionyl-tRNA formyltransferase [Candidatus Cloacimonadota bacterium]
MQIKNVVFMGTPQFAVPSLELLANTRFRPVLCITQPDKPKGRKRKLQPTEVKIKAQELGIEIIQPEDVNSEDTIQKMQELKPDVIITAAYGGYLKRKIRQLPIFGCLNLHPSLLPKYRGSAPINFALFQGDEITGNTIFKIVAKMDAGPVYLQKKLEIRAEDCYTSLYKKLSKYGANDVLEVLEKLEKNEIEPIPQDHEKATFSHKLVKEDFWLDWDKTAKKILNKVRGLAEIPGAVAGFRSNRVKIIEVEILNENSKEDPGSILDMIKNVGIKVSTADKDILVKRLQPAGKKIMTAHAFSLGARIKNGEKFENGF